MPRQETPAVTKAAFKVVPAVRRVYDASSVPRCPACGSVRVFECQLTPNLINVLRGSWAEEDSQKKLTDVERREAIKRALVGNNKDAKRGLEWGSCFVYSCEKDCSDDSWREEVVYVQWDV